MSDGTWNTLLDKPDETRGWWCEALGAFMAFGKCSDASRLIHPERHIHCRQRVIGADGKPRRN